MSKEVVIVGMARTPIGKFMGALSSLSALELAQIASSAAMNRAGIDPAQIGEVVLGMVYKHGCRANPARQLQIKLGLPCEGAACTVEQQCSSSLRALEIAGQNILLGKYDAALVCGVESMSNAPHLLMGARKGLRSGRAVMEDVLQYEGLVDPFIDESLMRTAENVAERYGVSRQEQDAYALLSQQRAANAIREGLFRDEIVPVEVRTRKGVTLVDKDEHPRETTLEALSALRPALDKNGTVTAGNASGINDGACAAVVMSREKAEELGLKPLVKILSTVTVGCPPEIMGIGPIYAVPKAVRMAGLTQDQVDYYEINEAFAAQVVPCLRELKIPLDKINANGSGIALGHPVGMTGLRLVISGYYELKRRGGRYGCASLCAGGGPAMAAIYEVL